MKRIVIATLGSLGDLHPYMALALGLRDRGCAPLIAAPALYKARVEAAGLAFAPLGSNLITPDRELYKRVLNYRKGVEHLFRDLLMPTVPEIYRELRAILETVRPDLLVGHPIVFAAPLLSEQLGVPWVSTVLAPMSFFSAHEPPVIPGAPAALARGPRFLNPWWGKALRAAADLSTRPGGRPLAELRCSVGLPPLNGNPLLDGQHSPSRVLAMFSKALGAPQPDWPSQTLQTGFCFYDGDEAASKTLDFQLARFLDAGSPPVVFTLGSTAVNAAGRSYAESAAAVHSLGLRALLLTGPHPENVPAKLPPGVAAFPYAPYAALFPRAAAVVHSGGVGTTAQVLRAGVPSLVVPFNFDQPDNAHRLARLGVARVIPRSAYNRFRSAVRLEEILGNKSFSERAQSIARDLAAEDGVAAACAALAAG